MGKNLMRRWLAPLVIAAVAPGLAVGSAALGQTKSQTSVPPVRSFDKLSIGNQTVAASLYQAQSAGTPSTRPLTLDQLAAKKRAGQEWGQIFRELKAKGLVHEKSLGQVVTRYGQFNGPELVPSANGNGNGGANGSRNGKVNTVGVGLRSSADGETPGHGGR